jgi:signal transduction histidine kinase
MISTARSLLTEARPTRPTTRAWWDRALVGVLLLATALEGLLRDDLVWRPTAIVLGVAVVLLLWWRSTHPLLVIVGAFGATTAVYIAAIGAGVDADDATLWTGACLLLLPYSLFRWGTGYEAAIGLVIVLAFPFLAIASHHARVLEALVGSGFFLFSATLGAAVRYRTHARLRDFEQVRLREREALARELHDTVAHHVSAIAIQAQAGRTLAIDHPDRALEVFAVPRGRSARCERWSARFVRASRPHSPLSPAWWTSRSSPGTAAECGSRWS